MANTPKKFSIQQVFNILLRKVDTKEIKAFLEDCKTTGLENTVELTYAMGGRGNLYIGGAFAHSKRATLNVESATWNTEVMALQNGTEIKTSDVNVTQYEILTGTGTTGLATTYTAVGVSGSEIGYAYTVNEDGTYGAQYEQGQTATGTTFTYSGNTLTFATAIPTGTKIAVAYTRAGGEGSQEVSLDADGVPSTAICTAFGLAKDICTGELYPCQIEGTVQIDGNYTFDLTADGDPAVHAMNMEFVRGCGTKKLYDLRVYQDEIE